jgi:hypothetical protein
MASNIDHNPSIGSSIARYFMLHLPISPALGSLRLFENDKRGVEIKYPLSWLMVRESVMAPELQQEIPKWPILRLAAYKAPNLLALLHYNCSRTTMGQLGPKERVPGKASSSCSP